MRIPRILLTNVDVLSETVQRLTFRYRYRNKVYYESFYLTEFHLQQQSRIKTGALEKDYKMVDKDYILLSIEMVYHNVIKNIEWLNRNRKRSEKK